MNVPAKSTAAVADHGGSLGRARSLFAHAPEPWVDLSTGINPHSYPLFDVPATALTRLPEPARARELCAVAARAYRAPSPGNVVAAPGTQILLPRVYSLMKPGRVAVLGPTYAEHARTAAIAGHSVDCVGDVAALREADIAVVVNPNNPDGRLVGREELLALAGHLRARGAFLVVDEAFMDVGPAGQSLCGDVEQGGVVVLRSFGKFFGLAGVRLGFAIAHTDFVARLDDEFGPWSVSGPALEYGVRALADDLWQDNMRAYLLDQARRLDALLATHGIAVDGGISLFRHVTLPDAQSLYMALGQAGVLVRNFAERPQVLRFGLPGDEEEWTRLAEALSGWRKTCSVPRASIGGA